MLYNPKWNQSLLAQALAFYESKPKDQGYDWTSYSYCACGQLSNATGLKGWNMKSGSLTEEVNLEWCRLNALAQVKPWTFGALADRIREAMEFPRC